MERPLIRVLLPLFRSFIGSTYFFKITKGSNLSFEKAQCQDYNLLRRHVINGNYNGGFVNSKGYADIPIATFRIPDQYQEVGLATDIDFRISGDNSRLCPNDIEPFRRESCKNQESMCRTIAIRQSHHKRIKQTDRQTFIHSSGSSSSSSPISSTPESTNSGTYPTEFFRRGSKDLNKSKGGTAMVEGKSVSLQWEISNITNAKCDNKFRYITSGLGSQLPGTDNRGSVVTGGEEVSYKRFRIEGSKTSNYDLHNKGEKRNVGTYTYGQYDCFVLPYENGGHQKSETSGNKQRDMGIPIETADHDYCQIPAGVNEYRSRQGVQTDKGLKRVEIETNSFQKVVSGQGNSRNRLVCIKGVSPVTSVYGL